MNEKIPREFAIVAAVGKLLEESDINLYTILSEEEIRRIDRICDFLIGNADENIAVAKRMFREAVDRLLTAEVAAD